MDVPTGDNTKKETKSKATAKVKEEVTVKTTETSGEQKSDNKSLWGISLEYKALADILESSEGELDEKTLKEFEISEKEGIEKVKNYYRIHKKIEHRKNVIQGEIDSYNKEIARLKKLQSGLAGNQNRLMKSVDDYANLIKVDKAAKGPWIDEAGIRISYDKKTDVTIKPDVVTVLTKDLPKGKLIPNEKWFGEPGDRKLEWGKFKKHLMTKVKGKDGLEKYKYPKSQKKFVDVVHHEVLRFK